MIVIEIKPSRLQPTLLVVLHLAAASSFVVVLDSAVFSYCVAAVLALSLFRSVVASRRGLPMALGLKDDGGMLLRLRGAAEVDAVPDGASVVLEQAVWLAWREQQGGTRRGALMLEKDQLAPPDWRRLQVWARLRVRPAAVAEGAGSVEER